MKKSRGEMRKIVRLALAEQPELMKGLGVEPIIYTGRRKVEKATSKPAQTTKPPIDQAEEKAGKIAPA